MKSLFVSVLSFCTCLGLAQDTLRIATYNLLNYPGTDSATRNPYFRIVVHTIRPDVLVVQEMTSQAGVDGFLSNVMNAYHVGQYSTVPFNNGPDTDNSVFYKTSKLSFAGATYIPTPLRDIAEYRFLMSGSTDTLHVFSLHLKANQPDTLARLAEATVLRNYLNGLPPGSKFVTGGDYNVYRSTDPGFQKLIGSEANDNGRCKDPLDAVGNWNNNFAFRLVHTQSPRVRSFGGGSTGGMDDRFDMLLTSYSLDSSIIPSSYTSYGNDGNHFNDSINRLPNAVVPDSVANALHYAADHLPVFADFVFEPVTSVSLAEGSPSGFRLYQNYPNPFNPSTTVKFDLPATGQVRIEVFDIVGRSVAVLHDGIARAGTNTISFNGTGLSTGIYFCRMSASSVLFSRMLVLLR